MSTYPCDCEADKKPFLAHDGGCSVFKCCDCGERAWVSPDNGDTYCTVCCPTHDFEYDRDTCSYRCVNCFELAPDDFFRGQDEFDHD